MKLHLTGTPPNEGARLLGRRIASAYRGNLLRAGKAMRVAPGTLQRLVAGEIVPGEELAGDVGRATANGIARLDWQRQPRGGWFDALDAGVAQAQVATGKLAA